MQKKIFCLLFFTCTAVHAQYISDPSLGKDSTNIAPGVMANKFSTANSFGFSQAIQLRQIITRYGSYAYAGSYASCAPNETRISGGTLINTSGGDLGYAHTNSPSGTSGWISDCYRRDGLGDVLCAAYVVCQTNP